MNTSNVKYIKELFEKNNIEPNKKLGQNFLINDIFVEKIISHINQELTVEIGPGTGILTKKISEIVPQVIAIEKDLKMINILKKDLKKYKNIEIINADALIEIEKIIKTKNIKSYSVVSNLPYSVATAIIRKFLELDNKPNKMILMVQKEVAERILAKPHLFKKNKFIKVNKKINMNVLAVSVQFYSTIKKLFDVPKNAFWPQPKVDSCVIEITPYKNICFDKEFHSKFFKILKAGFSSPRAQLLNNLSKKLKLKKEIVEKKLLMSNINFERRAETLNMKDWINLTKNFNDHF